jgi:hypothetical protein
MVSRELRWLFRSLDFLTYMPRRDHPANCNMKSTQTLLLDQLQPFQIALLL